MRTSAFVPVLLFALLGALVGCSGGTELTYSGPEEAYKKGVAEMEEGDHQQAIRFFRAVFEYGRGNEWAPDARFKLNYNRLTQLFPESTLLGRAEDLYSEAREKLDRAQAQQGEQSLAQEDASSGSN